MKWKEAKRKVDETIFYSSRIGMILLIIFATFMLMWIVAKQQMEITTLKTMTESNHVLSRQTKIDFDKAVKDVMAEEEHLNYTDGRVLFLMCGGQFAPESVKERVQGIYHEHGETRLYNWMQASKYIK